MEFFFFKASNPPLLLLSSEARSAASRNILLCSRAQTFLTFTQRGVLHSSPVWIPNPQLREAARNTPTLTARCILTSSVLSLGFNTSHNPLFRTTLLQSAARMPAERALPDLLQQTGKTRLYNIHLYRKYPGSKRKQNFYKPAQMNPEVSSIEHCLASLSAPASSLTLWGTTRKPGGGT